PNTAQRPLSHRERERVRAMGACRERVDPKVASCCDLGWGELKPSQRSVQKLCGWGPHNLLNSGPNLVEIDRLADVARGADQLGLPLEAVGRDDDDRQVARARHL